jgi:hypothetical protein
VVFEGIAKAKCWMKRGSTPEYRLVVKITKSIRSYGKVINLFLNYMIDSQNYSSTDTCLTKIHNFIYTHEIIYSIMIKSGNLGKYIVYFICLKIYMLIEVYLTKKVKLINFIFLSIDILSLTFVKQVNKQVL